MTAVVVLMPGLGNTAAVFAAQVAALAPAHRVVVADYAGATSIDEMAGRVLERMTGDTAALVGYSLGGYVAMQVLRRAAARVVRLALIATSPFADSDAARRRRATLIEQAGVDFAGTLDDIGRFVVFDRGPHAAHARRELVEMGLTLGVEEFCRQQRAAMHRTEASDVLAAVRFPVHVLCGRDDRVTPLETSRQLVAMTPGATLEVVPDAGHLLPLERPEVTTDFLARWLRADLP